MEYAHHHQQDLQQHVRLTSNCILLGLPDAILSLSYYADISACMCNLRARAMSLAKAFGVALVLATITICRGCQSRFSGRDLLAPLLLRRANAMIIRQIRVHLRPRQHLLFRCCPRDLPALLTATAKSAAPRVPRGDDELDLARGVLVDTLSCCLSGFNRRGFRFGSWRSFSFFCTGTDLPAPAASCESMPNLLQIMAHSLSTRILTTSLI
jgi:hypothetical protein